MIKDDTISRQAVINLIKRSINFKNIVFESRRYDLLESEDEGVMVHDVEALPSARSERPKGNWVYGEDEHGIDGYCCDKCGFFVPWDYAHKFIDYIKEYKFCPNCGANMQGEDNDG